MKKFDLTSRGTLPSTT